MDGPTGSKSLWKNLRQQIRLKGMRFCGSSWGLQVSDIPVREDRFEEQEETHHFSSSDDEIPEAEQPCRTMSLATALEAERQRSVDGQDELEEPVTSLRSLISFFEETDGQDDVKENGDKGGGLEATCCVCMERSKGAALIPCGHTYCRVCSREVWLNRGTCPLCNKPILEILDIF